MNRFYNTHKLYVVQLAQVTRIEQSGMHTNGFTFFQPLPKTHFAILKNVDGVKKFKLVTSGLWIYAESKKTNFVGDLFAFRQAPLALHTKIYEKYVSTKTLKEIEQCANKQSKQSKIAHKPTNENTK